MTKCQVHHAAFVTEPSMLPSSNLVMVGSLIRTLKHHGAQLDSSKARFAPLRAQ